jgi:hypothetical protein
MPLNDTILNVGATSMATSMAFLALHTANPEPSGTNPATSARVASGWGAAANGDLTTTNKNFTGGAANGPCTHVGFWSLATGGVFYGSVALTGDQTFNSAGEYTITSLTVNGSST